MTPLQAEAARWQQVKALLAQALELPPPERAAFVTAACEGDQGLRAELDSLLAAAEARPGALQTPPVGQMLQALQAHDPAPPDAVGLRLGAYRIGSLIARGGMGEVYRADRADGQFEQAVAIKLMRPQPDADIAAARFKAERQILASLDHPNLAKVLDGGVTDTGAPYFVMEYVAGEPIDQYCNRRGCPTRERLRLFRTVCQVVHYAHQKGVVHRDLKAANILVTHEGVVKLVDFGIAKRLDPLPTAGSAPADAPTHTATAWRAMTLAYASPEQVRGEAITPASDIYSLGVVLYRLLTGASPYPAATTDSDYELARAICDTEPVPPSRTPAAPGLVTGERRRLPADLDAVVLMALRKDPARRYASAEQLADDIFRHLEHLPVQARRGAWAYRASRFVLRHRAAAAVAALANLALLAGLGAAAWQAVEADRQRSLARQHLHEVRQLANVLVFDVYNAISTLPGSTPARQLVVRHALQYLQRAAALQDADPQQRLETARGLRNVGDLQGRYGYANLGDYPGALESYDAALRLLEPSDRDAPAPGPDGLALRREQLTVYRRKGGVLAYLGRAREADAVLRQGLLLAAALARDTPADRQLRMELAGLHGQHSDVLALLGDTGASLAALDTAIRLLEDLVTASADDLEAGQSLVTGYTRRGDAVLEASDAPAAAQQALELFHRAERVLQHLVSRHPHNTPVARQMAQVDMLLGQTLLLLQRPGPAVRHHQQAVRVLARLSEADPLDHQFRADLVKAQSKLSAALLAQGDGAAGPGPGQHRDPLCPGTGLPRARPGPGAAGRGTACRGLRDVQAQPGHHRRHPAPAAQGTAQPGPAHGAGGPAPLRAAGKHCRRRRTPVSSAPEAVRSKRKAQPWPERNTHRL